MRLREPLLLSKRCARRRRDSSNAAADDACARVYALAIGPQSRGALIDDKVCGGRGSPEACSSRFVL